jgi:hypothetical protein
MDRERRTDRLIGQTIREVGLLWVAFAPLEFFFAGKDAPSLLGAAGWAGGPVPACFSACWGLTMEVEAQDSGEA